MQLKPQDIVVLLKLVGLDSDWTYRSRARTLFMSTGEVHNALDRAARDQLFDTEHKRSRLPALEELLVHGLNTLSPPSAAPSPAALQLPGQHHRSTA